MSITQNGLTMILASVAVATSFVIGMLFYLIHVGTIKARIGYLAMVFVWFFAIGVVLMLIGSV